MPPDLDDFPALQAARALWDQGATDRALESFDAAVRARPGNVKALLEAARAFGGRFEIARAEALLDQAVRLAGDDPAIAPQIAASYGRIFREQRAIGRLEAIAQRSPQARAELAALYERAHRLDAALTEIDACIAAAPGAAEPRLARARLLRRRGEDDEAMAALEGLTRPDLPAALRAEAWTERCYLHDRAGEAAEAAAAIDQAHAILRALPQTAALLDRARANNRAIAAMARDFIAQTLTDWRRREGDPASVAHLTGFPRSGTTLLEQCLDAHPGLVSSPERVVFTRDILPRLCQAGGGPLTVATLDRVSRTALRRERRRYQSFMEAALGEPLAGRLHLDKNPNHTGLLPGLLRLHPSARIVFALRDPRDVVTSCVLRTFRLTEFSAMLLDWGTAAELYAAEMGAWLRYRAALPAETWVETRYEDMVADPMAETRRVLGHLGLPWDDGVARYRDRLASKIVNSPTQTEVRQPIYGHAVGRWRAYRHHLEPHLPVLAPFVEAFGYPADEG
ncbi:MAG: sulfotransferase [Pseudomonadota bacterium]